MEFRIFIKDINKLGVIDVSAIYTRLSRPDSPASDSIQKELDLRYMSQTPGPHPEMAIALIWFNGTLAGWVGTRKLPEKFKGETVEAQTIECFVDPEYRRRGFASMGLQALITAGALNRDAPVAVYRPAAVNVAKQCGCKTVLLCEPT